MQHIFKTRGTGFPSTSLILEIITLHTHKSLTNYGCAKEKKKKM